jgi:hypothetical protein
MIRPVRHAMLALALAVALALALALGFGVRGTRASPPHPSAATVPAGATVSPDTAAPPRRPVDTPAGADERAREEARTTFLRELVSAWLSGPGESSATDHPTDLEAARAHYALGLELFAVRDFGAALSQFEESYRSAPSWRVRFNIGQLHLQLDHDEAAREELEAYLAEGGEEIPAERRHLVLGELRELDGSARVAGDAK